jgi:hypothetical protein
VNAYGEKEDQEIAEGCRRLIKNAAICWNYLYLSRELATGKDETRKAELLDAIRHGSALTWKHFTLRTVVNKSVLESNKCINPPQSFTVRSSPKYRFKNCMYRKHSEW